MQVGVNLKTLSKALDTPNSRIVLGTGVYGFVYVILGLWVAGVTGIVLFFWSMIASMPGAGARDFTLPIGILAGAVVFAYLLGGWKSRLILDFTDYTYLHKFGLLPLMRRRWGRLDAFSHLSLTRQMETHGGNSTRYAVWKLALVPKSDAPATEPATGPIVITFAWWGDQTATATVAVSQRLAERVALPLRDESQEVTPEPKTSAWGCIVILCLFVGFVAAIAAYKAYVSRGPRFPVIVGTVQSLHAPLGPCRVRTLEVKAGTSYSEHVSGGGEPDGGGGSYTVTHTPYFVTLDIENLGAKLESVNFVVGFDASHRAEGSSGPLAPNAHRRVTVDLESLGDNPPTDLFLRSED